MNIFPSRHRGHLPLNNAALKFLSPILFTISIPQISNDKYRQVRHAQQVKDPKIDSGSNSNVAVADIILKLGSAHGALRLQCLQANKRKDNKDDNPLH